MRESGLAGIVSVVGLLYPFTWDFICCLLILRVLKLQMIMVSLISKWWWSSSLGSLIFLHYPLSLNILGLEVKLALWITISCFFFSVFLDYKDWCFLWRRHNVQQPCAWCQINVWQTSVVCGFWSRMLFWCGSALASVSLTELQFSDWHHAVNLWKRPSLTLFSFLLAGPYPVFRLSSSYIITSL